MIIDLFKFYTCSFEIQQSKLTVTHLKFFLRKGLPLIKTALQTCCSNHVFQLTFDFTTEIPQKIDIFINFKHLLDNIILLPDNTALWLLLTISVMKSETAF